MDKPSQLSSETKSKYLLQRSNTWLKCTRILKNIKSEIGSDKKSTKILDIPIDYWWVLT